VSVILVLPPHLHSLYPVAILLHDGWEMFYSHPTPLVYAIRHTILAVAISHCLLTLSRSTSPPQDQFPVRVCSCPLCIINRLCKGQSALLTCHLLPEWHPLLEPLVCDREDVLSIVTAGAKLTLREGTAAHLGNQGCCVHIHRRFIYKGDTRTQAQGTDPRMAVGAYGELP